jgi:phage terminase large subunit GpA-like protein
LVENEARDDVAGLKPPSHDLSGEESSDAVLFKERADGRGSILISGASSPASLLQVSMRRQMQDDLSKWENNAAGDPEDQANSRSRAFDLRRSLRSRRRSLSQGAGSPAIFEEGSQERYYVPCPHCGHEQTFKIENFIANIDGIAREELLFLHQMRWVDRGASPAGNASAGPLHCWESKGASRA